MHMEVSRRKILGVSEGSSWLVREATSGSMYVVLTVFCCDEAVSLASFAADWAMLDQAKVRTIFIGTGL